MSFFFTVPCSRLSHFKLTPSHERDFHPPRYPFPRDLCWAAKKPQEDARLTFIDHNSVRGIIVFKKWFEDGKSLILQRNFVTSHFRGKLFPLTSPDSKLGLFPFHSPLLRESRNLSTKESTGPVNNFPVVP